MASIAMDMLKAASDWLTFVFDAPFARAVVFGVNIGGFSWNQIKLTCLLLFSEVYNISYFLVGHLFVEGLLIVVIVFLLSQKSYKPPKRPLTKKVCQGCLAAKGLSFCIFLTFSVGLGCVVPFETKKKNLIWAFLFLLHFHVLILYLVRELLLGCSNTQSWM